MTDLIFDSLEIRRAARYEAILLARLEALSLKEQNLQQNSTQRTSFINDRMSAHKNDMKANLPVFVAVAPAAFKTSDAVIDDQKRQLTGFVTLSPPCNQYGTMDINWLYAVASPYETRLALLKHAIERAAYYNAGAISMYAETETMTDFMCNYGLFQPIGPKVSSGPLRLMRDNFVAAQDNIKTIVGNNLGV